MHTANTLAYLKKIFLFQKIYCLGILRKICILAWISQRKIISCILRFYNMFVKMQRVLANISKISSSLPQVGRTRDAKTFPLRNQSRTLESLKNQFRFPSNHNIRWGLPFHKNKDQIPSLISPTNREGCRALVEGCDKYHQ